MGRDAALQFSELGYTVFALCPNRQDDAGHLASPGGSGSVASVRVLGPLSLELSQHKYLSSKAPVHLA